MTGRAFEGLTDERADWMRQGACHGTDVEEFFPGRGDFPYTALACCARCSVRQECLDYAVANGITYGIFGGKTPNARRVRTGKRGGGSLPLFTAEIRQRIVWLRERAGWGVDEIAREFDCTTRTVSRVLAKERAT